MADAADWAEENGELHLARGIEGVARLAATMPAGEPGECRSCGEDMPRLVYGRCAPCRDGRTLGRAGR